MNEKIDPEVLLSYFLDYYGIPEDSELSKYYEQFLSKEKNFSNEISKENSNREKIFGNILDLLYIFLSDMRENLEKNVEKTRIQIANLDSLRERILKAKKLSE
jgi:hypothetical protein